MRDSDPRLFRKVGDLFVHWLSNNRYNYRRSPDKLLLLKAQRKAFNFKLKCSHLKQEHSHLKLKCSRFKQERSHLQQQNFSSELGVFYFKQQHPSSELKALGFQVKASG